MPDTPHPLILDRAQAQAHAKEHCGPQIELLEQIANYGTNLIVRAYESSDKDLASAVICTVLLRQLVAMFDGIGNLAQAGATYAAYLQMRAAFEASVYLDWMLFSDSERKATCYLVANYRRERVWANRAIAGTSEKAGLDAISLESGLDTVPVKSDLEADARAHLVEVDRILAQPSLSAIDREFSQLRGRRRHDPEWYCLCGTNSLLQISRAVKRSMEYTIYYSKGSEISHAGSYKDHIRIGAGQVRIRAIRDLSNMHAIVQFVTCTAMRSYQSILLRYRPTEWPALQNKYSAEWRSPFLTAPDVKYSNG